MIRAACLTAASALVLASCSSPVTESTPITDTTEPPGTTTTMPSNAAGAWIELTPMATPRSEMGAAVIDGLIYVPGGLGGRGTSNEAHSAVEVYDPATDAWELVADMPDRRHHLMVAALGGRLYVLGGLDADLWQPTDTVWSYELATDAWSVHQPMPKAIGSGAAVTLGDAIYVFGGIPGGRNAYRYDPGANTWEELPQMTEQREHVGAAVLDGLIYVVGGRWREAGERSTVEVYDPDLGTWAPGPDLLEARGGHGVTATSTLLMALGGERLATRQAVRTVEVLASADGDWVFTSELPTGLHGLSVAAVGDVVYVLGGSRAAAAAVNDGATYLWRP